MLPGVVAVARTPPGKKISLGSMFLPMKPEDPEALSVIEPVGAFTFGSSILVSVPADVLVADSNPLPIENPSSSSVNEYREDKSS